MGGLREEYSVFLFFINGVKNSMKYRQRTLTRAIFAEIRTIFCIMGPALYVAYAKGTAIFDENGYWIRENESCASKLRG